MLELIIIIIIIIISLLIISLIIYLIIKSSKKITYSEIIAEKTISETNSENSLFACTGLSEADLDSVILESNSALQQKGSPNYISPEEYNILSSPISSESQVESILKGTLGFPSSMAFGSINSIKQNIIKYCNTLNPKQTTALKNSYMSVYNKMSLNNIGEYLIINSFTIQALCIVKSNNNWTLYKYKYILIDDNTYLSIPIAIIFYNLTQVMQLKNQQHLLNSTNTESYTHDSNIINSLTIAYSSKNIQYAFKTLTNLSTISIYISPNIQSTIYYYNSGTYSPTTNGEK